jgi:hypothetical protein
MDNQANPSSALSNELLGQAIDTAVNRVRNEWSIRTDNITKHLEEAKRHRQAAEAEIIAAENTSRQFFDCLLATFNPDKTQMLIDAWQAQGSLVPDKVRLLLQELYHIAPPLSPTQNEGSDQPVERSQASVNTIESGVTARVPEPSKNGLPPVCGLTCHHVAHICPSSAHIIVHVGKAHHRRSSRLSSRSGLRVQQKAKNLQ